VDGIEERMRGEIEEQIAAALAAAEPRAGGRAEQIFDHVYADPPARVLEQRRALRGDEGEG
jgi:TPP-dependent pyruvate/acetoin dehydrogenase alpha subunit